MCEEYVPRIYMVVLAGEKKVDRYFANGAIRRYGVSGAIRLGAFSHRLRIRRFSIALSGFWTGCCRLTFLVRAIRMTWLAFAQMLCMRTALACELTASRECWAVRWADC